MLTSGVDRKHIHTAKLGVCGHLLPITVGNCGESHHGELAMVSGTGHFSQHQAWPVCP